MSETLSLLSALVHGLGFWLYGRRLLAGDIEVNSVSWIMRGYGATVLFLLWSGVGVPLAYMAHSTVSGVAAILIALLSVRCGRQICLVRQDFVLFAADGLLLGAYLALLVSDALLWAGSAVLILTVIRKIAPFWPILRTTVEAPVREQPGPWIVWASGYGLFGLAAASGGLPAIIQSYAGAMVVIHLAVATATTGAVAPLLVRARYPTTRS